MAQRVSFAFLVALAVGLIAACGRQVTPNPPGTGPGGTPPGYLAVFFTVYSPFNFSNYQYMVVFNTSGDGVTPSTDTLQTNWAGYRFALVALGNGIASSAELVEFVPSNGHGPPAWLPLHTNPVQLSYNPNSNGSGTEYSMLAEESIFKGVGASSTPANVWTFNAFTIQQGASQGVWKFADSMGDGGPIDPQFNSPSLDMCVPFDNIYHAHYNPPDQTAQIVTIEIANNPPSPLPKQCP